MKKFIKDRNIILFASAIVSIVFIIIAYALVIRDMGYFRLFFPTLEHGRITSNAVLLSCRELPMLSNYTFLLNTLILLMSLFNLIGYVTKRVDLHLIAVGIGLYLSLVLVFYITPIANVMLLLNVLLILLGLIDSTLEKVKK